jgi:hypothetical protein
MLSAIASAPGRVLRTSRRQIERVANADTVLFVGWAMATAGVGLESIPAGLIVGGVSLAAGALFVARGDR